MKVCLIILLFALSYAVPTPCNSTYQYTLVSNGSCYIQCPWNPPLIYYNYAPTLTCQSLCPPPYFAFDGNQTCITTCPTSPNITYYDSLNRKCVTRCPANYYAASNQSCLASCPTNTYGNSLTGLCVSTCPNNTFYDTTVFNSITVPICAQKCGANKYGYSVDQKCYAGGSCPTTPVRYFADDTTNLCVMSCPVGYFADNSTGRCLIYCSSGFYASTQSRTCVSTCAAGQVKSDVTRSCVKNCPAGYYVDPLTNSCVSLCTSSYYGDSITGRCTLNCSNGLFGDQTIKLCVSNCSVGYYADNFTQLCVLPASCYSNTVGDPTTRRCVNPTNCPRSPFMFADLLNKLCVTRCPSPSWGQPISSQCVSSCPWSSATYVTWSSNDTRQCVTQCPSFPVSFADNVTKQCVAVCPQSPIAPFNTYADSLSRTCVRTCPSGYQADPLTLSCIMFCQTNPTLYFFNPSTGTCVTACPLGSFADTIQQRCVTNCTANPRLYGNPTNNKCVSVCTGLYFGDNSTGMCVLNCPQTTLQYADSSTNLCVAICPKFPQTYGQIGSNGFRKCVATCDVGLFADPITRACVPRCNFSQGYYGQKTNPIRKCVIKCPPSSFANPLTSQCVSTCPSSPLQYYGNPDNSLCVLKCPKNLYGNINTKMCVSPTSCPTLWFADDLSGNCVRLCPVNQSTFGQPTSMRCLKTCPQGLYADNTTRKCVSTCSASFYKDYSTKLCVKACPSTPKLFADPLTMNCSIVCSGGYFRYQPTRTCVSMCPSTPPMFADLLNNICVNSCRNQTYSFFNNTFRGCLSTCPPRIYSASYSINLYADNSTWSCVQLCPVSQNLYNFAHPTNVNIRVCLSTCPIVSSIYYFAQNSTQSCVTSCPTYTLLTYGDIFTMKCVANCSRKQFRDNTTNRCVYTCQPGWFADNTTFRCVQECPVGLFASSINNTCVRHCPTGFYADNFTKYCVSNCTSKLYLYSDNTTWQCVLDCPAFPDLFADNNTKLCSLGCTGGNFADSATRDCLPALNCSSGRIGDPTSGRCVDICPIAVPSFLDDVTNLCVSVCASGMYADNSTMNCVAQCPSQPDYFAYNHSTLLGLCVLFCPVTPVAYYRHIPTRQCVTGCPSSFFRDTTTMNCVSKCPPYYYAQIINSICVLNCSINNKYGWNGTCVGTCPTGLNKDPTKFLCVQTCPFGYFAQLGVCITNCVAGYADPFTKICASVCSADYYSYLPTRQCRQNCQPQYKYFSNQSCIVSCPVTSNHSTNLYMDTTTYSCLNKCLPEWYSDNNTRFCTQTCSTLLFADNSTGRCVSVCPTTPEMFGYNLVCYTTCPIQTPALFAQNTTRLCTTICPVLSFADSYVHRCVAICTGIQYGYNTSTPTCVSKCPGNLYGNNLTKTCVSVCPDGTFGQNTTRLCLERCPQGSFAEIHLNLCVSTCNISLPEYADGSSNKCVTQCPSIPSLYGQIQTGKPVCTTTCINSGYFTLNTTRMCVTQCPSPYFADPITLDCAFFCQSTYNYYADNVTRTCSATCPNVIGVPTYADDSTKKCVWTCPFLPSLYGVNQTNRCQSGCPSNSYGDNDTRLCVATCFFGITVNSVLKYTFGQNTTRFCLRQCPPNSWADNLTYLCVSQCSLGSFADSSTWRCVLMCPSNPVSFAYVPTRQCILACPTGYFASDVGRICMNGTCPSTPNFYFKDFQNNQCVLNCTFPYFGQVLSQSCVQTCSYGYYQDLGAKRCLTCPTSCLTCINSANCTTCVKDLYLFQGQCLTSCPTFPVYYYKYAPTFTCIVSCPSPYFGFNQTGSCQTSCPANFFSNLTTSTCQPCPAGCSSCQGSVCAACNQGYKFVLKYSSCSKMCSITLPFYLLDKCSLNCPAGTFMLDDLVTCQKCNSVCSQCSVLASNCTVCQGSFWYNYNCVKQCPNDYYVDRNNSCQQCLSNPSACSLPPLNYTVSSYVKQYVLYLNVTFNRAVDLDAKQFAKVAQLKTSAGPLKSSAYKITKSTPSIYILKIIDSSSLNQLSVSLSFQPGSIFDVSGNGMATSSATISVSNAATITPQMQQQAAAISQKANILGYLLLTVLLLLMFKTRYPLIILLDLLQLIHMHIYILINPLPYLYMQVLSAFKNVNFVFLPTFYNNPSPLTLAQYNAFQNDTTLLGNCQPFVYFVIIFGGAYFLVWICSKSFMPQKLRKTCKKIIKQRMKYSFIHQIFYYTQYYVLFFALYQFSGANSYIQQSSSNLALSVIIMLAYLCWIVAITYFSSIYTQKLPKKFSFLRIQPNNFGMQVALRILFKLMVVFALISGTGSVQLVLLIVFNSAYLIFTACYSPSKSKITNVINSIIHIGFIFCQFILFAFQISDQSNSTMNTYSLIILSLMGTMITIVISWMIYRAIVHIRQQWMGILPQVEAVVQKSSVKQYEKIQTNKGSKINENVEKDMNISQLNFKDQQDQQSQAQITAQQAVTMFTYHMVPKKHESLLKQENKLLGIKQQKKQQQIIIQIDQDQLINRIDSNSIQIDNLSRPSMSRESNRPLNKNKNISRIKSGRISQHLKINSQDVLHDVQEIKMQKVNKKNNLEQKSDKKEQNRAWQNIQIAHNSEQDDE